MAAFLASMGQAGVATPRKSEKEELLEYDLTVWNKSRGMVKEMEKEMNRLGVPLFLEGVDYGVGDSVLREWRARVVELLEDLCEDEGVA